MCAKGAPNRGRGWNPRPEIDPTGSNYPGYPSRRPGVGFIANRAALVDRHSRVVPIWHKEATRVNPLLPLKGGKIVFMIHS